MITATLDCICAVGLLAVSRTTASVALLLSYLTGSIPFGYLLVRVVRRVDIRKHGSGNIGATNVGRILGWQGFIAVLVLDFLKGFLPVLMIRFLLKEASLSNEQAAWYTVRGPLEVLGGATAIAGHLWPPALGFRGGKGVATSLGVVAVLAPWATLIALGTCSVTVAATRYMSLGSILAVLSFAVWQVVWIARSPETLDAGQLSLLVFSIAAPAMVLIRHRSNIVRLWRGTESRMGGTRKTDQRRQAEP